MSETIKDQGENLDLATLLGQIFSEEENNKENALLNYKRIRSLAREHEDKDIEDSPEIQVMRLIDKIGVREELDIQLEELEKNITN